MDGITAGAAALSTYGLYCIVAVLAFVSYKLYAKTGALEKEFRDYMQKASNETKEAHEKLLYDCTTALNASTQALKDSTEALNKISLLMERVKVK